MTRLEPERNLPILSKTFTFSTIYLKMFDLLGKFVFVSCIPESAWVLMKLLIGLLS